VGGVWQRTRISSEIGFKRLFGSGQNQMALLAPAEVLRDFAGHVGRKPSFQIIADQSNCCATVHFPTPGLVNDIEQKPDHSDSSSEYFETIENKVFREIDAENLRFRFTRRLAKTTCLMVFRAFFTQFSSARFGF
jgi:hypothetical protein